MRNLLLVFLILFGCQVLFSSPDPAIRYRVKVELANTKTYEGYIYRKSIMGAPNYDESKEHFLDYFKKVHFPDTLMLYRQLTTYKVNDYIELDFTSSKHKVEFLKKDIKRLELLETLKYQVGSRLQEIDDSIYANLNFTKLHYTSTYDEQFSENCSLLLISEMDLIKLKECQAELEYGLKKALKIPPTTPNIATEVNQYLDNERECLKQKSVLLLSYCDAL